MLRMLRPTMSGSHLRTRLAVSRAGSEANIRSSTSTWCPAAARPLATVHKPSGRAGQGMRSRFGLTRRTFTARIVALELRARGKGTLLPRFCPEKPRAAAGRTALAARAYVCVTLLDKPRADRKDAGPRISRNVSSPQKYALVAQPDRAAGF